jgi:hypothetical protein
MSQNLPYANCIPSNDGLVVNDAGAALMLVTIAAGFKLKRGTVLGQILASTPSANKFAGQYVPCVATATDGSQVPTAILAEDVDTSTTGTNWEKAKYAYRSGSFNSALVVFDPSWTLSAITAALVSSNITL